MREDEKFVAEAMSRHFDGPWKPVEDDPPDFFLTVRGEEVAVEVTGIFELVLVNKTKLQPRHSQDSAIVSMCDRLDRALHSDVPTSMTVIVVLSAPLLNFSRCEKGIGAVIRKGIEEVRDREESIVVMGNNIRIHYALAHRAPGKKIIGLITNSNASSDILGNTRVALDKRLAEKNLSCQSLPYRPLWLALWNCNPPRK